MPATYFDVPANSVLPILFDTFDSNGASVTMTGLAVTDIEIYKGTSITQRASDAGYALIDTDGIDIDALTGIHGFSIDLSDNTDAGFYAVGSYYNVVVSAITISTQTVSFIAARFRIVAAEAIAGKPKVDVDAWLGTAAATPTVAGVPEVDATHVGGTVQTAGDIIGDTNDIQARLPAALVSGRIDASVGAMAANVITATAINADAITAAKIADGAIDAATFAASAITSTVLAADAITAAKVAADVTTELQAGLATSAAVATLQTSVNTIDDFLDTEIAAILADTDNIQTRLPAALVGGRMDSSVGAMAADVVTAAAIATDAVNEIADGILDRNMATGTDSGSTTVRTVRQALRFLRNKWTVAASTLTVTKEDDVTASWTSAMTATAGADPITGSDPAGP